MYVFTAQFPNTKLTFKKTLSRSRRCYVLFCSCDLFFFNSSVIFHVHCCVLFNICIRYTECEYSNKDVYVILTFGHLRLKEMVFLKFFTLSSKELINA